MFSEVNSLLFLLIFLAYGAVCLIVCQRFAAPLKCCCRESLQKLFLCGLIALVLTVVTIYLWYVAVLLLVSVECWKMCCHGWYCVVDCAGDGGGPSLYAESACG